MVDKDLLLGYTLSIQKTNFCRNGGKEYGIGR